MTGRGGRLRVGVSGSYGGLNMGDEAILHAILAQLRGALPVDLTVFTRDSHDTLRRHGVERAVANRDLSRDEAREEVGRLDLLILGGGGILFDAEAELYLREVQLAHELDLARGQAGRQHDARDARPRRARDAPRARGQHAHGRRRPRRAPLRGRDRARHVPGRHSRPDRVMPIAMATGQGAGVCAALAARAGQSPHEVDVRAVQDALRAQGADLGG